MTRKSPVRIPEKVLRWRERLRKGTIMKPRTFKRISKEATKRYRKKRAGPAAGGKAYWITTLRKYLFVHPGDTYVQSVLRKLSGRRYKRNITPLLAAIGSHGAVAAPHAYSYVKSERKKMKRVKKKRMRSNPRSKFYVGFRKKDRFPEIFSSSKKPTQRSHGHKYSHAMGPTKSYADAVRIRNDHLGV